MFILFCLFALVGFIHGFFLGCYLTNNNFELNKARQAKIDKIIDDLHK